MTTAAEKDISAPPSGEVDAVREEDTKATTSDNDTGERPVRRKLKETRITSDANGPPQQEDEVENSSDDGNGDSRGRLTKKRSRDDLQAEKESSTEYHESDGSGHRRKRSRDSKDDNLTGKDIRESTPEQTHGDDASHILSPKKKRSLDQLQKDSESVPSQDKQNVNESDKSRAEGEREKKRHRDASEERRDAGDGAAASTKPSLPASFLNTSVVSPFASLSAKSGESEGAKDKVTSPSAFAASGLASFARSEQSPFGALGSTASTASIFKKADSAPLENPAASGFAAAAGSSPFASTGASGFAGLGSGLGSGFGGGFGGSAGKLSSFASTSGPGFGVSASKPFGAGGESDDEDEEEEEDNVVAGFEKEKEDERFYEQQIETGEEEEQTYFSSKAKLFHFTNKEWKERGIGTFKVNVKEPKDGENDKLSARMIMRADGVLRVMLNSPIFKGMPVGDVSGEEPKTQQLNLASIENGRTVPLLLRLGKPESAKELYHVISDLQKRL